MKHHELKAEINICNLHVSRVRMTDV